MCYVGTPYVLWAFTSSSRALSSLWMQYQYWLPKLCPGESQILHIFSTLICLSVSECQINYMLLCSIIFLLLILEAHNGKVSLVFQFETISKFMCDNLVHLQVKIRLESCSGLVGWGCEPERKDSKWGTIILTHCFLFYVDVVVGMQRV